MFMPLMLELLLVLIPYVMIDIWNNTVISYHLLYSTNPSLCTDTTGCGTFQSNIYNIVKHNYYTLHININTYNVSGSGKCH